MIEGYCHCGAIHWQFKRMPESATACNCTVCRRYGVLCIYDFEGEGINVSGKTEVYVRGKAIGFHFCPTCGCVAYWCSLQPGKDGRRRIAVNLRLNEPEAVAQIPIDHFDGLNSFQDLPRDSRCVADYWFRGVLATSSRTASESARSYYMTQSINLAAKLATFNEHWQPRVVGEFDGHDLMVVKVKGEFVWHTHENTDDFFLVLKGKITIRMRDGDVTLGPGELFVVPKGVEHCPLAEEESHLLLIEPSGTLNTGNAQTAAARRVI